MRRKQSIGSAIMVFQEQFNHQQRLHAIYSRNTSHNIKPISDNYSYLHSNYSKKQRYEDQKHLESIRHLVQTLNRPKTMAERQKDPHDFFAYPALFFRDVLKSPSNNHKKQKKPKQKKTKTQVHISDPPTKITLQKIRQFLPLLSTFEQSDFQQFTDGINKMIISFDIVTREELQSLQEKVMSLLPQNCPQQFLQAAAMMFQQIEQQMDQ